MSNCRILAKKLYAPEGIRENCIVTVENGRISEIAEGKCSDPNVISVPILTFGLFDIHNHGGEGFDLESLDFKALEHFLEASRRAGVTDLLLTLLTASPERMSDQLAFVREAMKKSEEGTLRGARIRGAHLEGPFLNPEKAGAQELCQIALPSVEAYSRTFDRFNDIIRLVTIAPEREGALELADYLCSKGIAVQAGHTACSAEQAVAAFAHGVRSVCHTFNACPPIHHRSPGLVTEALIDDAVYCEAICDLTHLHPSILKLIYRCKGAGRMIAISDSTMPKGLPDGRYFYANQWVVVRGGERRCENGALNGGLCYLDGAVRNLISIGIDAVDALRMASRTPAERLGLSDRIGTVEVGKDADLVGFTDDFIPVLTVVSGKAESI